MTQPPPNPFNITKATDFSDEQIVRTWVDLPGDGFFTIADPTSPMPMILSGGKGSGRTHLMRYFSYPVQKLRHPGDILASLKTDGYVGVYLRCTGLNAGRFHGKGQSSEVWDVVFAYYMDLWLTQLTLQTMGEALAGQPEFLAQQPGICMEILNIIDTSGLPQASTIESLIGVLHQLQRDIDVSVNNVALDRRLDVNIRATRGELVFRIPQIFTRRFSGLDGIQILYLVDELENLTEAQQRYIQTLIREREAPTSFKVGARRYGLRTYKTLSADEENREGSEFQMVFLDRDHIENHARYTNFARSLIARRIVEAYPPIGSADQVAEKLDGFFEDMDRTPYMQAETSFLAAQQVEERPYFTKLKKQLSAIHFTNREASEIVNRLSVPDLPLVEKLNVFLFYQDWSRRQHLLTASASITQQCAHYLKRDPAATRHVQAMAHFRTDLFAQLLRDSGQKQRYLGLSTLIDMSAGLPRNLLQILKYTFKWASFNGQEPFSVEPIKRDAQQSGVMEASHWFFEDARVVGDHGREVEQSIERLATLFRQLRYSDKPVECSLITFSADLSFVRQEARAVIKLAEEWSLLISIPGGQRDRNTGAVDPKFELNPMLCPRWDLPISRRGAISLSKAEVNAIFYPLREVEFDTVIRDRLGRMMAPFRSSSSASEALPGFGD